MTAVTSPVHQQRSARVLDYLEDLGNPAMGLQRVATAAIGGAVLHYSPDAALLAWIAYLALTLAMLGMGIALARSICGPELRYHPLPLLLAGALLIAASASGDETNDVACTLVGALLLASPAIGLATAALRLRGRQRREHAVQQLVDQLVNDLTPRQLSWCAAHARERLQLPGLTDHDALLWCARWRGTIEVLALAKAARRSAAPTAVRS